MERRPHQIDVTNIVKLAKLLQHTTECNESTRLQLKAGMMLYNKTAPGWHTQRSLGAAEGG
jgi:hypothetical protein